MDVERTIEFLLQQNAAFDARMQQASERMDRAEGRMDRAEARMDRFEHELRVLSRLGARAARRAFSAIDAATAERRELQASLKETQTRLDAVIVLLERHFGGGSPAPA